MSFPLILNGMKFVQSKCCEDSHSMIKEEKDLRYLPRVLSVNENTASYLLGFEKSNSNDKFTEAHEERLEISWICVEYEGYERTIALYSFVTRILRFPTLNLQWCRTVYWISFTHISESSRECVVYVKSHIPKHQRQELTATLSREVKKYKCSTNGIANDNIATLVVQILIVEVLIYPHRIPWLSQHWHLRPRRNEVSWTTIW